MKAPGRGINARRPSVDFQETSAGFTLCDGCLAEERTKTPEERTAGIETESLLMRRKNAMMWNSAKRSDRDALLEEIRDITMVRPSPSTEISSDPNGHNLGQLGGSQQTPRPFKAYTPRLSLGIAGDHASLGTWNSPDSRMQERFASQPGTTRQSAVFKVPAVRPSMDLHPTCYICQRPQPREGMWEGFQEHHGKLYCTACHDKERATKNHNVLRADGTWGRDEQPQSSSLKSLHSDSCFMCQLGVSKRGWRRSLADEPEHVEKQYCFDCYNKDLIDKALGGDSDSDNILLSPLDNEVGSQAQASGKRKRAEGDEQGSSDDDVIPVQPKRLPRRSSSQRQGASQMREDESSEDDEFEPGATAQTKEKRLGTADCMAYNERKWEDEVLSHPEKCKEWLGMTCMTFRDMEEQLVRKGGLRQSQGISTTERLALFLNLMTTGNTILEVARQWSPEGTRGCKTVIDVGMDVVDCFMRLASDAMPYTRGRKGNAVTPPITKSLHEDKEVWDNFKHCLGGVVHICHPKRRASPSGIESTSRVIIAGFDGIFKSVKILWEKHAASSFNLNKPPKGSLDVEFWKTFIVANKPYTHIDDVDGLLQVRDGSTTADQVPMDPEKLQHLFARAQKPSQRAIRALKMRMLRSPQSSHDNLLARKVLNNHPDLVPACCVVYNLMARNGEFDPFEAMVAQYSDEDEDESGDEDAAKADDERTTKSLQQDIEMLSEPEMDSGDDDHPSQSPHPRKTAHNIRFTPEERREFNDNMIKGILDDPVECKKWFGISKRSFNEVLRDLIAAGLPESAAMSKMERLALFLNLMTTGDPILQVARRFGPRVCNTVGSACESVVRTLMRIINRLVPYTTGRERGAERAHMPEWLVGEEQVWEHFHDCIGSVIAITPPERLHHSAPYQSISRAIVATIEGHFKSIEIQWKCKASDFDPSNLGSGDLVAPAIKTFVISDIIKAKDIDGLIQVEEGPQLDHGPPEVGHEQWVALHTRALELCDRSTRMLRKRLLLAPHPTRDKTTARQKFKRLPELVPAVCVLFNMLVELGEFDPRDGPLGDDADEGKEGELSALGDGQDGDLDDHDQDVTQFPGDEDEVDEDGQDQIMAEAGVEVATEAAGEGPDADDAVKPGPEVEADVAMIGTVDRANVKREVKHEVLGGVKHEVVDNDDDIYD